MRVECLLLLAIIIPGCVCTNEAHRRVRRVIGGEPSEENEWPWVASLQGEIPMEPLFFFIPRHKKYTCGASVLNDRWLLTAAHCFDAENAKTPEYWKAVLGSQNRKSTVTGWIKHVAGKILNREEWQRYRITLDAIIIYPGYDKNQNWLNDLALIRLSKDVPSGEEVERIRTVSLPQQGNTTFPPDGFICHVAGWGCNAAGGSASEIVHDTTLPKVRDADCASVYGVSTRTRLCAGRWSEATGICPGDSGGPLSCYDGEKWLQVGIASFTSANRPGNFPGAFTRVSMYTDWIERTIAEN